MGVEPTEDIRCLPAELKSAKPTGTHTLPRISVHPINLLEGCHITLQLLQINPVIARLSLSRFYDDFPLYLTNNLTDYSY